MIVEGSLLPGTYTSVETVPAGWALDAIACSDANSVGDVNSGTATFEVEAGETVICTFTNTELGTMVVEKQTDPDGSTEDFAFTGDVAGTISDGGTIVVTELEPGTYTSVETVPAGWLLDTIACSDADSGGDVNSGTATFEVEAGEMVTCTFTNTELGTIVVEKQTDPDGSTEDFVFTGDAAGTISDGETIVVTELEPGTYTSVETVAEGWLLDTIACSDASSVGDVDSSTATFQVEAGETVTCTFANAAPGTIVVEKQTDPDAATGNFSFSGDAAGTISDGQIILVAELGPGTYAAVETASDGWVLDAISCSDANSVGDVDTSTATFQVEAGETVTCTFTNTELGMIVVEKQTNPDGATQGFVFAGGAAGTIADGGTIVEDNLLPGTYTSVEAAEVGWALDTIACSDTDSSGDVNTGTATFEVEAGETVTCTFTNTEKGTIVVEKQTDPDGAGDSFSFNGDAAGAIADGGTIIVPGLEPGSYTSLETVPAGWALDAIACSDDDSVGDVDTSTATFNVEPGETVTCTFTNTELGTIVVEKQTNPGGRRMSLPSQGTPLGLFRTVERS